MLGLKRGTVRLEKADKKWPGLYEKEKKLLRQTLGKQVVGIEHVGSTAIPGLTAKPIIDIVLAIPSTGKKEIEKIIKPLEKLGYHYMHKFPARHFFAKGPENKRTHHLSIVKAGGRIGWQDTIMFRDHLLRDKKARKEYAGLKQELAKQFPNDRASYTKAKEKFIKKTIENTF